MAQALRKPYTGEYRSLVVAIDVGTTFSGVSYAILEPGEIPKIHGVTRFPGQEHVAGNTKIPSVIYYDRQGKVMAAGAEADTAAVVSQAEDEGWIRVELFKLRLRPRTMRLNMNGMRFSPLPKKKTAVEVFGDFLSYLFHCTRIFITDTHANGAALWSAVEHNMQFVLSHPNGWEGPQQSKMRRAAIHGGLIPDTNAGKARIWFVTEGEASLHACVLSGLAADVLSSPSQHGFVIADAGGGTLDISSYAIRGTAPLVIEEIAPPDCIFAGSVFVSRRAREFLEEKLRHSKYGTPDALDHITRKFDETTKRLFRDTKELQFIAFGSPLDKDPSVGIRSGQLKLTGQEVAKLFEPSVEAAVHAIIAQLEASKGMIKSVFLVGGYAASPWLFGQLQERLGRYGVIVSRPDSQTSKAVADGAVGFFCDHHVSVRMSKFLYGVEYLREFDGNNPDHVSRRERLCELPSGPKLLPDAFDCILARGVQVKESTVFTRKYSTELTSLSFLSVFEVEVWCYRSGNEVPTWIERNSGAFSTLCIVQADLSLLSGSAKPKVGRNGKQYWTIVFSVEIHFGLTEFKARMKWVDNGNTKYGPATIIYNEHGHRPVDEDEPDTYPEDDHFTNAGTPRSERHRSLPASRARTPTEPHHPASPGGYEGNSMYSGDGTSIRGIPPPSVTPHPHDFVRERTSSKPATPKVTSPVAPQIEREWSTESRRASGMSRGRERTTSVRDSRGSSIGGGRIGDALSSVWGAEPQLKSPIQPHSPQPPAPQPPSQSHTQSHTPKAKSRKPSMSSVAHVSPQLPLQPPQPQLELSAQPQSSPRSPRTPAHLQGVVASPRHSAPSSPRSSILPASRGISRIASPAQRFEQPLSPLNPSAQVQPEPGPTITGAVDELWGTNGGAAGGAGDADVNVDTQEQHAGWDLGDTNDMLEDSAAAGDTSMNDVPGSFNNAVQSGDLLEDDNSHSGATAGGATTLLSGSISTLMSSNPVSGLSNRLSSFGFGFGSGDTKKTDRLSASGYGLGFLSGTAKPANMESSSGNGFGLGFGSGPGPTGVQQDIELQSNISGTTANKGAERAGTPLGGGQASSRGQAPQSALGSRAVTPNPATSSVAPEQTVESTQAQEPDPVAGGEAVLEPPAEDNQEQVHAPEDPVTAAVLGEQRAEEQVEEKTEGLNPDPESIETTPGVEEATTAAVDDWDQPGKKKKGKKGKQAQKESEQQNLTLPETTTSAQGTAMVATDNDEWASTSKKKGKKSKQGQQLKGQENTPTGDTDEWDVAPKGKKKNKKGARPEHTQEETQGGDEWESDGQSPEQEQATGTLESTQAETTLVDVKTSEHGESVPAEKQDGGDEGGENTNAQAGGNGGGENTNAQAGVGEGGESTNAQAGVGEGGESTNAQAGGNEGGDNTNAEAGGENPNAQAGGKGGDNSNAQVGGNEGENEGEKADPQADPTRTLSGDNENEQQKEEKEEEEEEESRKKKKGKGKNNWGGGGGGGTGKKGGKRR